MPAKRLQSESSLHAFGVAAALLVGLGLRLYHLTAQPFWVDEIGVWWASVQSTLGEALGVAKGHVMAMPLHYAQVWLAARLGLSGEGLRLPDALWGTASLYLGYRLARRYADRRTALLTIWLLALSPTLIMYSQELRFYAALVFFYLAVILAGLNALQTGRTRAWLCFYLVGIIGLLFHIYTILGLGVVWGEALRRRLWAQDRRAWRFLLLGTIGLALGLAGGLVYFGGVPGYRVPLFAHTTLVPFLLGGMGVMPLYPLQGWGWLYFILFGFAALAGLILALRRREGALLSALGINLLAVGLIVAMNAYRHYFIHSRQILFLTFWAALLAARGIAVVFTRVERRWPRAGWLTAVAVLVVGLSAAPALVQYYALHKTPVHVLHPVLAGLWQPGEGICVIPDYDVGVFWYYWQDDLGRATRPCTISSALQDETVRYVLADPGLNPGESFRVYQPSPWNTLYPKTLWVRRVPGAGY